MSKKTLAVGLGLGAAAWAAVSLKVERADSGEDLRRMVTSGLFCSVAHGQPLLDIPTPLSKPTNDPLEAKKDADFKECIQRNTPKPSYNISAFGFSTGHFRIVPR